MGREDSIRKAMARKVMLKAVDIVKVLVDSDNLVVEVLARAMPIAAALTPVAAVIHPDDQAVLVQAVDNNMQLMVVMLISMICSHCNTNFCVRFKHDYKNSTNDDNIQTQLIP